MTPAMCERIKAHGRAMYRKGYAQGKNMALPVAIYSYLLGIATGAIASLI